MSCFLFDFDGTLVDSMPTFGALMIRILNEEGVEYPDDIVKIITPLGYAGTARYFIEKLGVKSTEDELICRMNEYALHAYSYEITEKEGVREALLALKEAGHSLSVLTASPHETLDPCLIRLGLYGLFDNVWSCNDFGTTKSNPEIYLMAAELIGAAPENITFLDDNIDADKTAKLAGLRVIGVYDESSAEYEGEMRRGCDGYVRSLTELIEK